MDNQPATHGSRSDRERMLGAIAYIGPLFIVSYLMAENSKFVKYHASQGLVFFLAAIVIRYGLGAIMLAVFIPTTIVTSRGFGGAMMYGGAGFVGLLMMLVSLALLALAIVGIVKAAQGEEWEMPVIGKWAKKINS